MQIIGSNEVYIVSLVRLPLSVSDLKMALTKMEELSK